WNIIGTEFLEENDIGSLAKLHNVDDLAERIRAMFCLTRTSQDDMFKRTRKYAEEYLSYLALNERRMSFWRQVMSETSEPSTFEK
ncbi:MAG: hypothetical protein KJ023_24600, partial [Burkholderiaceae bacterium]|nr:hypothetical protein [Burkholderiaceae bacterium]